MMKTDLKPLGADNIYTFIYLYFKSIIEKFVFKLPSTHRRKKTKPSKWHFCFWKRQTV